MGGEKSLLTHTVSALLEDDDISECSDVEEEGYADFTKNDLEPYISMVDGMQLKPTINGRVKQKFDNHRQVKKIILSFFYIIKTICKYYCWLHHIVSYLILFTCF